MISEKILSSTEWGVEAAVAHSGSGYKQAEYEGWGMRVGYQGALGIVRMLTAKASRKVWDIGM